MDITRSLAGVKRKASKKGKANSSQKKQNISKQKQKQSAVAHSDGDNDDNDSISIVGEDDSAHNFGDDNNYLSDASNDSDFIKELLDKKNIKEGRDVVKRQKNLKTNKDTIGGGSFQSMGLKPSILKTLLLRGFNNPTPIQRAALPAILATPPRDVVGMARTGSGKTLAYIVPLIQRLGAVHSPVFGCRALVLAPSRELALQVLKVGKDISRTSKEKNSNENTDALRWGLIVGGDSLEDQFKIIASNPDVLIATPGRLLHLIVEMNLDLNSVEYVVFDEADRLFEMGFAVQLHEIIHRLPSTRQTLLFSATLPKTMVEFAKAGLQNPKLIRLDADTKISSDLQMAFLSVKPDEKLASLLVLLRDVIGVPLGKKESMEKNNYAEEYSSDEENSKGKEKWKKKRKSRSEPLGDMASHQTIVFVATKHHVELLEMLLQSVGFSTSAIFGSMDQGARRSNLMNFRTGRSNVLVVTDLAARGIDIPILENVVNYDFPVGQRQFVHRVGRTARAGRRGFAYSFVTRSELPFLLDLQLFLSRPLHVSSISKTRTDLNLSENIVLGTIPRESLDMEVEYVHSKLLTTDSAFEKQYEVVGRAQTKYERSQSKASAESYRRAKELSKQISSFASNGNEKGDIISGSDFIAPHPIFKYSNGQDSEETRKAQESSKMTLLRAIDSYTPNETTFEVGKRGKSTLSSLMQSRRATLTRYTVNKAERAKRDEEDDGGQGEEKMDGKEDSGNDDVDVGQGQNVFSEAEYDIDENELRDVFEISKSRNTEKRNKKATRTADDFKDNNFFMSYVQPGAESEKGYLLKGDDLASQGTNAIAYDVGGMDEDPVARARPSMLRWDRKNKKFVKGDGTGSDNKKLVKTESGVKLPATYRSGVYDEWRQRSRVSMPKVGDRELAGSKNLVHQGRRYRHTSSKAGTGDGGDRGKKTKARSSGHAAMRKGGAGTGVKSVDQVAKERRLKANRKRRSTQPSKKK